MKRVYSLGLLAEGKRHCPRQTAEEVGEEPKPFLELPRQVQREGDAEAREEHKCPLKTAGGSRSYSGQHREGLEPSMQRGGI